MGISRRGNWLSTVRTRFLRSSRQTTIVIRHSDATSDISQRSEAPLIQPQKDNRNRDLLLDEESIAAVKIQSYFRRHLARRAFRALKGLVKLQALVRGVCVRRQARIAMHFMHALARLQITVRARQLLTR